MNCRSFKYAELNDYSWVFNKYCVENLLTNAIRDGLRTNQIVVTFSSESFTKLENDFLVDQINSKYSLKSGVRKCNSGTGFRIVIPQSKNLDFLNLIGDCPFESLKYKWKY